jgi:hypothetical protein
MEDKKREDEQKPSRNYELDIERLQEIEKMQKMLFSRTRKEADARIENRTGQENSFQSNSKQNSNQFLNGSKQKLIEHANFIHNFAEYHINPIDLVSLYLIKHDTNSNKESNYLPDTNFIPVTTNVIKKDKDTIEITRVYLYDDYYNNKPYPSEKIVIKRNAKDKENFFISFFEDKMKKTITSISADSIYTKVAKFKSFRTTQELLFYQNIFHYKCILDMYNFYKLMNKIPPKKDLVLNNLYYHEFMKNLL